MRQRALCLVIGMLATAGLVAASASGQQGRSIGLVRVADFAAPTYVTAPPDDGRRLFVTERSGRIVVVRDGRTLATPFLDIRDLVQTSGESGLLSMAFAPSYPQTGRFYVYFVDNSGAIRIEEFRRSASSPDLASRGTRRLVLRQRHNRLNHKGGQLQIGPDRKLFIATGDGGGRGDPDDNAQNRTRLLGKVLRIDPRAHSRGRYGIPGDNPFARRAPLRGEVYAYGLRNPYRFSFDRLRGHLIIGDVGQNAVEEVDFVRSPGAGRQPRGGYNFGWPLFEGRRPFRGGSLRNHFLPALQRFHSQGVCSITGGYVIRDPDLAPFSGQYVYGDLCDPNLRITHFRGAGTAGDRRLGPRVERLVSFGEDARGRVYAVSIAGPVFRLALR